MTSKHSSGSKRVAVIMKWVVLIIILEFSPKLITCMSLNTNVRVNQLFLRTQMALVKPLPGQYIRNTG